MPATHIEAPTRVSRLLFCRQLVADIEDVELCGLFSQTAAFAALLSHPGDANASDYCIEMLFNSDTCCEVANVEPSPLNGWKGDT